MKGMSELAVLAWNIAGAEALSANFECIEPAHFLISLTEIKKLLAVTAAKLNFSPEETSCAQSEYEKIEAVFSALSLDSGKFRRSLRSKLGDGGHLGKRGDVHRSPAAKRLFERAKTLCVGRPLSGADLLKALMQEPDTAALETLKNFNLRPEDFLSALEPPPKPAELPPEPQPEPEKKPYVPPRDLKILSKAAKNLVALAGEGAVSPCVGRTREISRIMTVLWIDNKKIPVLVGAEGVGKNSIVETLAARIWEGKAGALSGKTIMALDARQILAGRKQKVQLQKFLQDILEEAKGRKDVILYVRDIQLLLEAERGQPFEVLKPALLSGETRFLASVDEKGWESCVSEGEELSSRFEKVEIPQNGPAENAEILKEWRARLEVQFGEKIEDGALFAALELSSKFKFGPAMPKKAIDILKSACASALAKKPADEMRLSEIAKRFSLEPFGIVHELWVADAVAKAAEASTETVVRRLSSAVNSRILRLEKIIKEGFVGQDEAADKVFKKLIFSMQSDGAKGPPVFMFLGPAGVGKTELGRRIAAGMFGGAGESTVFDMSLYSREEGIGKIFGNEYSEGILPDFLRRKPLSVVLFENTEKTRPYFFERLREFLKTGPSRAKPQIDINEAVFVLSSSMFAQTALEKSGYPAMEREVVKKFKAFLPRHLLEIITDIVAFRALNEQLATRILLGWLEGARTSLREKQGVNLQLGRDVERFLAGKNLDKEIGVRQLRMRFDEFFSAPLRVAVDTKALSGYSEWKFVVLNNRLSLVPKIEN